DDRRAQHDRSGVDRRRIVGVVVGRTVVARIGVEMRPVIAGPVVTRTIAVMAVHPSAEGEADADMRMAGPGAARAADEACRSKQAGTENSEGFHSVLLPVDTGLDVGKGFRFPQN